MKKSILLLVLSALTFAACADSNPAAPNDLGNTQSSFYPRSKGSTWTYTGDFSYTVTILGDTTLDGKTWTMLNNSIGGIGLLLFENNGYYSATLDKRDALLHFLKENAPVGTKWSFDYMVTTTTSTYDLEIKGVGLTRVVEGHTYTDVIHVHQTTSMTFQGQKIPYNEGDYYYAKGVGFIESDLGALGGKVRLASYTIM